MNPFLNYWLFALGVVGAVCLSTSGRQRKYANTAFIVVATFLVLNTLAFEIVSQSRSAKVTPILEADRAELMLRFNMSLKVVQDKLFKGTPAQGASAQNFSLGKPAGAPKEKDFNQEAVRILEQALKKSPQSHLLEARLAVVLAEEGNEAARKEAEEITARLSRQSDTQSQNIGRALALIYGRQPVLAKNIDSLSKVLEANFAPGWFRDVTMLSLYRSAGDNQGVLRLSGQISDKAVGLFMRFICVFFAICTFTLVGLIVLLIQLGGASRRGESDFERQIKNDARRNWSYKTVYVVFILWLTSQIVVGNYVQNLFKQFNIHSNDVIGVALTTALIYLSENGPGLLYIFWLALRPSSLSFWEGIGVNAQSKSPLKLVAQGIFAWCAAIPLVMLAFFIATSLFGSQGSSNPIIAIILEASRSPNHAGSLFFYVTLAVLAPLCEEPLFRGFLYTSLRRRLGVFVSLVASAFLFAVLHLDPGGALPLFALGLVFGYTFERTGSLIPSMVAHGLWNAGSFTVLLLFFSW